MTEHSPNPGADYRHPTSAVPFTQRSWSLVAVIAVALISLLAGAAIGAGIVAASDAHNDRNRGWYGSGGPGMGGPWMGGPWMGGPGGMPWTEGEWDEGWGEGWDGGPRMGGPGGPMFPSPDQQGCFYPMDPDEIELPPGIDPEEFFGSCETEASPAPKPRRAG